MSVVVGQQRYLPVRRSYVAGKIDVSPTLLLFLSLSFLRFAL